MAEFVTNLKSKCKIFYKVISMNCFPNDQMLNKHKTSNSFCKSKVITTSSSGHLGLSPSLGSTFRLL
ncbi:CLUMA_CG017904, isoform A [Clunio marinus]|uniref:CLUMA_CG017904, isoform A n=1 Tax=Clunio marinus TaxID=568069 RepID=A0A1J1IX46_9DIPT|nr:CLUMA_CG017904, isoform A [Clunio marinus]